jgi:hypothetical protein
MHQKKQKKRGLPLNLESGYIEYIVKIISPNKPSCYFDFVSTEKKRLQLDFVWITYIYFSLISYKWLVNLILR